MNRFFRISIVGLLAALAAASQAAAQVPRYTIQQFLKTTRYAGGSFSPDGNKLLVSSDQTGTFNAFAIPVDGGAS